MKRPDWDEYFLGIARAVAARADCTRRQVGAVIVCDNRIIATGYNGAPSGQPGCLTFGACPRGRQGFDAVPPGSGYDEPGVSNCIAIHAEANALLYADGNLTRGATLYCTDEPCDGCTKLAAGAGIKRVIFFDNDGLVLRRG